MIQKMTFSTIDRRKVLVWYVTDETVSALKELGCEVRDYRKLRYPVWETAIKTTWNKWRQLEVRPTIGCNTRLFEFGRMIMEMSFCDAVCFGHPDPGELDVPAEIFIAEKIDFLAGIAKQIGLWVIDEGDLLKEDKNEKSDAEPTHGWED